MTITTIDGVPRELLERIAQWGSVTWMDKNELRAIIAKPITEQVKQTYLIGYTHARGTGRCIETFNGEPTAKEIEALEHEIERRADLWSVGIMSISRIGNSDE